MIPTEDNYVEWFICAARFQLLRDGYAFLSFALPQVADPGFPAAKLLAAGSRLVGLRFLAPADAPPTSWEADPAEHARIAASGGRVLYALPHSSDALDQQLTHQKVLFAEAGDVSLDGTVLTSTAGIPFKQLVERLESGTCGTAIAEDLTAAGFLAAAEADGASLHLCLDSRSRLVFALKAGA